MTAKALGDTPANALFELPCACQNLRRLTRVITRIYDQELKKSGLEITQFGLLTALAEAARSNQKRLSAGFAMDSTTLTRTLGPLLQTGLGSVKRGKDRRERLFSLTAAGKRQLVEAQPLLGAGRAETAERTWGCGLEAYERECIADHGSRPCMRDYPRPYRCIYIYYRKNCGKETLYENSHLFCRLCCSCWESFWPICEERQLHRLPDSAHRPLPSPGTRILESRQQRGAPARSAVAVSC